MSQLNQLDQLNQPDQKRKKVPARNVALVPELQKEAVSLINFVSKWLNLDPGEVLRSKRSTKELSIARKVIYYIAVNKCGFTKTDAGRIFKKDHSTVLNAINEFKKNKLFHSQVEKLCEEYEKKQEINKNLVKIQKNVEKFKEDEDFKLLLYICYMEKKNYPKVYSILHDSENTRVRNIIIYLLVEKLKVSFPRLHRFLEYPVENLKSFYYSMKQPHNDPQRVRAEAIYKKYCYEDPLFLMEVLKIPVTEETPPVIEVKPRYKKIPNYKTGEIITVLIED